MEKRSIIIKSKHSSKMAITIIPGHFATNHSHVNYYIDMTSIKHVHTNAEEAASQMAEPYSRITPVDTIICMDGCEVIGAFLAHQLARTDLRGLNSKKEISVITPEFNANGQFIFRDNMQPMVWGKKVLLLIASATTGKTINRSLECIQYYGGEVVGISAIFSAIDEMKDIEIKSLFKAEDLPDYRTYPFHECPDCQQNIKIDAIVNSFGYSKINM